MSDSLPSFLASVETLGHKVFKNGNMNPNFIGIRSHDQSATFNDWITCWYKDTDGAWQSHWWSGTTDPGIPHRLKPINPAGAGAVVPGQYPRLWKLGLHNKSKPGLEYKAFEQAGPVSVYRDNDKNAILEFDPSTLQTGMYACNMHASDSYPWDKHDKDNTGKEVGLWSAMCQVLARSADFRHAYLIGEQAVALGFGDRFTYTLVREEDVYTGP